MNTQIDTQEKEKQNILINETWIDSRERIGIGESGVYETRFTDIEDLFKTLQKEYGRCVSKIYIDTDNGNGKTEQRAIGWVFEKCKKYEDSNNTYLLETWVTLHNSEPVRTIEYDYKFL